MVKEMIASIITGKDTITFSNEDLPLGGIVKNNALYLTILCLQKHVPLALIDNGSIVEYENHSLVFAYNVSISNFNKMNFVTYNLSPFIPFCMVYLL